MEQEDSAGNASATRGGIPTFIRTLSGRRFDFTDHADYPFPIGEIAEVLSRIGRFNNHTRIHYSVAQHSVLVSDILLAATGDRSLALQGLLHDAAEVYVHDVMAPLKQLIGRFAYDAIERSVEAAIATRFGLPMPFDVRVGQVDKTVVWAEIRDLMNHDLDEDEWPQDTIADLERRVAHEPLLKPRIVPIAPRDAEALFLSRHHALAIAPGAGTQSPQRAIAPRRKPGRPEMIRSYAREKRIEASLLMIHGLAPKGSPKPGILRATTLMKLLYLLDVRHIMQTGLAVTDLQYRATVNGPVPIGLRIDLVTPDAAFAGAFSVVTDDAMNDWIVARRPARLDHLTRRETGIMMNLIDRFRDDDGSALTEGMTHSEARPWVKAVDRGHRIGRAVDLLQAIEDDHPHRAALLEAAENHAALRAAMKD